MDSMTKQRRESEANGPRGQRPARVSRGGPSWTEFFRLAHQAIVAIAGAGMINRAEPWPVGTAAAREARKLSRAVKGPPGLRQTEPGTASEGHGLQGLGLPTESRKTRYTG